MKDGTCKKKTRMNGRGPLIGLFIALFALFALFAGELAAFQPSRAIRLIRKGDPNVLARVSYRQMMLLHNYRGQYYYISRRIGARALRSLLGCLKNPSTNVRKICADNLYNLKLTYVHKKLLLYYINREKNPATRLALQDLLVRINENRFIRARGLGDGVFLAKIQFSEISDFVEKSVPGSMSSPNADFRFFRGGTRNNDSRMKIFSIRMLAGLGAMKSRVVKLLRKLEKNEGDGSVLVAIRSALLCQEQGRCEDVNSP